MSKKIAVVCVNEKETDEVLSAINKEYPEWGFNAPSRDLWYFYGPEVVFGLCESDSPFEEDYMRIDTRGYFARKGYEVVDFYDCCEVKDLGEMEGLDVFDILF